jgi:hypothetical protein
MSLLTIVSDAMAICGFSEPSIVYASSDDNVSLFKRLSQVEGDALSRKGDWRGLKVLGTLTGDGSSTEYTLPADFDRFMTGYPLREADEAGAVLQLVTDDELAAIKTYVAGPTKPVWRLFGDTIEFYPALDSGQGVTTEYRSSYWISDETGATRLPRWSADTDYAVIPERLMTLGLVWRYKQSKGLTYDEDFRTYELECAKAMAAQNARQPIKMRSDFMGDYTDGPISDPRVVV